MKKMFENSKLAYFYSITNCIRYRNQLYSSHDLCGKNLPNALQPPNFCSWKSWSKISSESTFIIVGKKRFILKFSSRKAHFFDSFFKIYSRFVNGLQAGQLCEASTCVVEVGVSQYFFNTFWVFSDPVALFGGQNGKIHC